MLICDGEAREKRLRKNVCNINNHPLEKKWKKEDSFLFFLTFYKTSLARALLLTICLTVLNRQYLIQATATNDRQKTSYYYIIVMNYYVKIFFHISKTNTNCKKGCNNNASYFTGDGEIFTQQQIIIIHSLIAYKLEIFIGN